MSALFDFYNPMLNSLLTSEIGLIHTDIHLYVKKQQKQSLIFIKYYLLQTLTQNLVEGYHGKKHKKIFHNFSFGAMSNERK